MSNEPNNYIKILEYLTQFIGDGKYYQVINIVPSLFLSERRAIIEYLINEGFVNKKSRTGVYRPLPRRVISTSFEYLQESIDTLRTGKRGFVEYEIMITLKGASYLEILGKSEKPNIINIHLEKNENSIVNKGDNINQSGSFNTSESLD